MKNQQLLKFLALIVVLLFISEILKYVLDFDKLLQNSLAEQMTANQIESYFKLQKKWEFLAYLFIPLYVLIKTVLIATTVYVGAFFFSKNEVVFKKIWGVVLSAEFIFLLVPIAKLIWFYFFQTNYNLEDLQYFYPLSALNIIGYKGLDPWLIYPLQTLNLFELAYIIYLSYQIGKLTQTNADTGLKIVGYSYVTALILWVCVVMFLTLNYS